jgi:hypothetical protein
LLQAPPTAPLRASQNPLKRHVAYTRVWKTRQGKIAGPELHGHGVFSSSVRFPQSGMSAWMFSSRR